MTARNRPGSGGPSDVRFQFGKNWARFLSVLDSERIAEAESSLTAMLNMPDLRGRSFLDVGSGSGLFSLAAKRLGATRVHSFDYDEDSVACTRELKRRFLPHEKDWTIEHGSVLDEAYLRSLGLFDIVYSWGVLHHTGDMWRALSHVVNTVNPGGWLYIAIYNDQGQTSRRWLAIKRLYNRGVGPVRIALLFHIGAYFGARMVLRRISRWQNPFSLASWRDKKRQRGMSIWHDLVDWVGGYPFEVARPEEVFEFCAARGFALRRLKTVGGRLDNNQFVFEKTVLRSLNPAALDRAP